MQKEPSPESGSSYTATYSHTASKESYDFVAPAIIRSSNWCNNLWQTSEDSYCCSLPSVLIADFGVVATVFPVFIGWSHVRQEQLGAWSTRINTFLAGIRVVLSFVSWAYVLVFTTHSSLVDHLVDCNPVLNVLLFAYTIPGLLGSYFLWSKQTCRYLTVTPQWSNPISAHCRRHFAHCSDSVNHLSEAPADRLDTHRHGDHLMGYTAPSRRR